MTRTTSLREMHNRCVGRVLGHGLVGCSVGNGVAVFARVCATGPLFCFGVSLAVSAIQIVLEAATEQDQMST